MNLQKKKQNLLLTQCENAFLTLSNTQNGSYSRVPTIFHQAGTNVTWNTCDVICPIQPRRCFRIITLNPRKLCGNHPVVLTKLSE